jgi:hypothetical protein
VTNSLRGRLAKLEAAARYRRPWAPPAELPESEWPAHAACLDRGAFLAFAADVIGACGEDPQEAAAVVAEFASRVWREA